MIRSFGSLAFRRPNVLATALTLLAILASFAAGAGRASAATTVTFSGPELLGKPTATSVDINIVPDAAITYYYEYGTASGTYGWQTSATEVGARTPGEVTISGLTPNTKYYYRMKYHVPGETDWVTRPEYSFWTQRAPGSSFTFTITSDGHSETTGVPGTLHARTWTNVKTDRPDFNLDLGDAFILGGLSSQAAVNSKYLTQRGANYFGAVSNSAAIYLAAGNHEDEEGWNLDDAPFSIGVASIQARKWYYPTPVDGSFYSGNTDPLAAIDEAAYGDELREDYYAWQWGDVLFVVIDPFQYTMNLPYAPGAAGEGRDDAKTGDQWSWTLGARQYNWLKQTLEGSAAKYKFVFSHQMLGGIPRDLNDGGEPGYVRGGAEAAGYFEWGGKNADGTEGFAGHRNPADFPMPIHQLFLANGVNAYFHGHDHQFAYETRDGIVYQEVPSPSMNWTDFPNVYAEGDHGSYQTIEVLENTGHLRVQVTPDGATVTYVRSNLGSSYTYTILPRPTLTTAVDPGAGGTVAPAAGTHLYNRGAVATVTATPAAGYRFDHWSGDCAGTGACEVTMNADKSVTAHFALMEYALTVSVAGDGAVMRNPDQATYHYGDAVELTAVAAPGWKFSAWSGDLSGPANPASVTIAGDTAVTATFVDALPPETAIDSGPSGLTNSAAATFSFSSSEEGSAFECALDDAAFAACVSPVELTGLADGPRSFAVRATDAAGNTDPSPATATWTIDTSPFTLDALALRQSPDEAAWSPVTGDLAGGYTVSLDPAQGWRYLDVGALAASHQLEAGDFPFTLDPAALPAGWLDYWAAKGVTADAAEPWQQQMWLIVNGRAPIFFLRVDQGSYRLVDGLLHALGQPDAFLRVNGDYPLGAYAYTGSLTDSFGVTLPVTARMTFIGPAAPAAPVVTVARDGGDARLTWPAVTIDATDRFTVVTAYQVFRSAAPFFTPGPADLIAETSEPEYRDTQAAGAEGAAFYLVRAVNIVGPSADSNHTAVFTYTLSPGAE